MEKLPNDVLSNIFIRLLAKQLAQMRSVSKLWNALLCQPSLIKSHLHHSLHNNDEVLLFFTQFYDDSIEPISVHPSRSPNVKLTNFIKTPVNFPWDEDTIVIGSVSGLICYSTRSCNNDCVLHIWNPSLSAFLTLPPHSLPSPGTGNDKIRINFGFGFDPKADDYKVVKIASLLQPSISRDPTWEGFIKYVFKEWLQVEVYSMRKGSWKPITQTFPSHITGIIGRQYNVCVDGHDGLLHWLGFIGEEKNKGQTIVAYDLGAETFHEIPLPDSLLLHDNGINCFNVLGFLAGKLCVMSYVKRGEFEVWVMDEYGMVESWIKHHAFSQFRNIVPFGFTLRNQLLFIDENFSSGNEFVDYRYGLFDLVASKTKFFRICADINKVVAYVDSLVWVAPGDRERAPS